MHLKPILMMADLAFYKIPPILILVKQLKVLLQALTLHLVESSGTKNIKFSRVKKDLTKVITQILYCIQIYFRQIQQQMTPQMQ